jgi:general secretion pathway protein D
MKPKRFLFCFLWMGVCFFVGNSTVHAIRVKGEEGVTVAASKSSTKVTAPVAVASAQTTPASRSANQSQPAQENQKTVQEEAPKEPEKATENSETETRYVTIDFDGVDITVFIKFISELTGKNFVIDEKVRGKVTIISPTKVSINGAYRVFESVLEVHGFTTVPSGNVIKIVPAVDARAKNIATKLREEAVSPDDRVETRLIPLRYADPEELKKHFAPLISKNGVMIAYAPTGMLIVTDVKSNIVRLLKIIDEIDVEGMGEQISVLPLEYATASDIAKDLNDVFQRSPRGPPQNGTIGPIKIVPYDRTNDLIVKATEADTVKVKALILLLDKEPVRGEGDIHVKYLQNANAEDLAQTLTSIRTGDTQTAKKGETPIISKDVQIVPDKATNSLVILAKKEDYVILEDVIDQLDIVRRMVHIEALIMEVDVNKDLDVGVEWQVGETVGSHDGSDLTAFGNQAQGTTLAPLPGFTYGLVGEIITIGNQPYASLGAVINAMETESNVYIRQTPQITTMDNEEAEIVVAKNVPFQTRVETTGDVTGREFASYEYKDVGVTLKITPQINQQRSVRLNFFVEVSQVVEEESQAGRPTTLKRSTTTTVSVEDAHTLVIGGLIDKTQTEGTTQTPCLGSIPLLGWLFKSATSTDDRTNLYIFLTPHIIETPDEAEEISRGKMEDIERIKDGNVKLYDGRPGNPEDMELSDQGFELLEDKEYDKAKAYFERALEINPDNPYALLNLGVVYDAKGEKDKAVRMYQRVIRLDPEDRAALSTDPDRTGERLVDIARDNLKRLQDFDNP